MPPDGDHRDDEDDLEANMVLRAEVPHGLDEFQAQENAEHASEGRVHDRLQLASIAYLSHALAGVSDEEDPHLKRREAHAHDEEQEQRDHDDRFEEVEELVRGMEGSVRHLSGWPCSLFAAPGVVKETMAYRKAPSRHEGEESLLPFGRTNACSVGDQRVLLPRGFDVGARQE